MENNHSTTTKWVFSDTIKVDIVNPEKTVFSGEMRMVIVTGEEGEIGILPGHVPLITTIKPGQVRLIDLEGQEKNYYISNGFLEVQPSAVTILADTIILAKDIDEALAIEAKTKAEEILARKQLDNYTTTLIELSKAVAQISAVRKWQKIK